MKRCYWLSVFVALMCSISVLGETPTRVYFPGPYNGAEGNSEPKVKAEIIKNLPNKELSQKSVTGITASILAGANYIKHAQSDISEDNAGNGDASVDADHNDGGWDWVLTLPAVTHSGVASPKNLYGVTALGLYYSYLRTGDATYKIAMDDVAGYIISDAAVKDAFSIKFLILYNSLSSVFGSSYRDAARTKFDSQITAHGGTAQTLAEYIRELRAGQGYHNGIIGWDLGSWVEAAQMLSVNFGSSYHTAAVDIAEVAYNASYTTNANYFDLVRCSGWDVTLVNKDYWWYTKGVSGLLVAFQSSGTHPDKIPDLLSRLYASQATGGLAAGAFCDSYGVHADNDDWQTTAYCVMALGSYYKSSGVYIPSVISNALNYLSLNQDACGGWVYSDHTHYPEIGGECTSAFYFYDATVSTAAVTGVTQVYATSGGAILYNGGVITGLGVCWSTSHNPTIANNHTIETTVQTGSFSSTLTGLVPGTTYYVRSYVSTSVGTNYGNEVSFTTLPNPVPSIAAPLNGITGVSILPYFQWNLALPSYLTLLSYDLNIYDGATVVFTKNIPWSLTGLAYYQLLEQNFVLLNNHNYTWTITANFSVGAPQTITGSFTTVPAAKAVIYSPSAGSTVYTYSPIMFTWSLAQSFTSLSFQLQYVKQSSIMGVSPSALEWANPAITKTINAGSNLSLYSEIMSAGTKYWVRVITLRGSEVISYSDPLWYKTSGGAAAVSAIPSWPVSGNIVYTNSPTLYWYTTSGDLTDISFQVRIYKAGVLLYTLPSAGTTVPGLSLTIPDGYLEPGVTYSWEVITYYKFGTAEIQSVTSAQATFKTNGVGTMVKPVCSYPVGVTVYNQSPTFYWYLGAYAAGVTYTLYIDGAPEYVGVDQLYYTTSTVLAGGSTHTWYVKASNGITTVNSDPQTFTVAGGLVQGKPVTAWPVGNPTIYSQTPTLSWTVVGSTLGLDKFRIAFSSTPSPVWSNVTNFYETTNLDDRSYTMNPLPFGTHLYWAIAGHSAAGWSAWSTGEFTIVGGLGTVVPVLSYPIGGVTIYSTTAYLSWYVNGSSAGIDHYKVEYAPASNFNGAIVVDNILGQSLSVSGLVEGATYYWRVSAHNGSTFSTPSPTGIFTVAIGAYSAAPLAGSPANGVVISASSPMISWILPTLQQSDCTYELQYSDSKDMNSFKSITGIKSQSQVLSGLSSGKAYFWRVRSVDNKGVTSGYSDVAQFSVNSVTSVASEKNIPAQFGLEQNYPNPFNPSTIISYSLPQNSFVTIKIYDMIGREVKTLVNDNVNAGVHSVEWHADDNSGSKVASGTYLYRMTANDAVISKKLTLIK